MERVAEDADACMQLGGRERDSGKFESALNCFRQALSLDPKRVDALLEIAKLLAGDGQPKQAATCLARALEIDARAVRPVTEQALTMAEAGYAQHAEAVLRRVLAHAPHEAGAWYARGAALEFAGQRDGAKKCYHRALEEMPGHGLALGAYLSLSVDDVEPRLVERAQGALAANDTHNTARALIGYGLAKHHDRQGAYRKAAEAGHTANSARQRDAGSLDREALKARVDDIIRTYTPDFFTARRRLGLETDQPVFIVGLPRSGTTLCEQILSAHSLLHGAGELPDLARIALGTLTEPDAAPWRAADTLDQREGLKAASVYLDALRRSAPSNALRISDKSPLNFFHLAFAALLFPNARVIHCSRDLRDNALSIWMENFNPDQQWSTDFSDLAFYAHEYRRLMAHWRKDLPLPILEIRYEDTVADLETQARRLIDFLGAPWDDRCLDFHKSDRAVQTPSRWQVRQPIYTRSVGRWKAYAEHLPELLDAFPEAPA